MPARTLACRRDRAALANGNCVGVAREPLGLGAANVACAFWSTTSCALRDFVCGLSLRAGIASSTRVRTESACATNDSTDELPSPWVVDSLGLPSWPFTVMSFIAPTKSGPRRASSIPTTCFLRLAMQHEQGTLRVETLRAPSPGTEIDTLGATKPYASLNGCHVSPVGRAYSLIKPSSAAALGVKSAG